MKRSKVQQIFLAQFAGDHAPFNNLNDIARWAANLGYEGVQIPSWDARLFDLKHAAESKDYCERRPRCPLPTRPRRHGTLHPFAGTARRRPSRVRRGIRWFSPRQRSRKFHCSPGMGRRTTFVRRKSFRQSRHEGARHVFRRARLAVFVSVAATPRWIGRNRFRRTRRALESNSRRVRQSRCRRLASRFHPGEDLHDGITFEMFLQRLQNHPRCNILFDPSHFRPAAARLSRIHRSLSRPHKNVSRKGRRVPPERPPRCLRRFSVLGQSRRKIPLAGDGQVDFKAIFSKLTQYGFDGWAVLEWECCIKSSEQGAAEGAPIHFAAYHSSAGSRFDDFRRFRHRRRSQPQNARPQIRSLAYCRARFPKWAAAVA